MNPVLVLVNQIRWAGRNISITFTAIPPDRLDWKPEPTAKSVPEIVNHCVGWIVGTTQAFAGDPWRDPEFTPARTVEEARTRILDRAERCAVLLESFSIPELERMVQTPEGNFPVAQAAMMLAIDLLHHHGQISYLETLMGDTEEHFDPDHLWFTVVRLR